jgi:hypothetical protein
MVGEFEQWRAAGRSPAECVAMAESRGLARLEIFKALHVVWGDEALTDDQLQRYGSGYPSPAAQVAATEGLAGLVRRYSRATEEEFAWFERLTGISRKVDALAMADRTVDALAFYDRLDPESLILHPTTGSQARAAVRRARAERSTLSSTVVDFVARYRWGWLLSAVLDQTDRPGPIPRVDQEARPMLFDRFIGVPIEVTSDEPHAVFIERYEQTGWPMPRP